LPAQTVDADDISLEETDPLGCPQLDAI